MLSFEVAVDSGQMSIVPFSDFLSTRYELRGIYKVIESTPGDMICISVGYTDEGGWGERISEISARVGKYDSNGSRVGSFTVPDNGKIVVSDPCYIMDGDFYGYEPGATGIPGYDAACHASFGEAQAGMFSTGGGMGACSNSGIGDGCYPLRLSLDSNGKFVELTVDFFPKEWEDDHDEDEEHDDWSIMVISK